jgi:hypothetical protein
MVAPTVKQLFFSGWNCQRKRKSSTDVASTDCREENGEDCFFFYVVTYTLKYFQNLWRNMVPGELTIVNARGIVRPEAVVVYL